MNSSAKGFGWERELAKKLSLWITKGQDKYVLWRQGGSGGMATNLRKRGVVLDGHGGDIVLFKPCRESELFTQTFFVETKRIKGGDLWPQSKFYKDISKYMTKAIGEAEGKIVLLIINPDRKEPMVFFSTPPLSTPAEVIIPPLMVWGTFLKTVLDTEFEWFVKDCVGKQFAKKRRRV